MGTAAALHGFDTENTTAIHILDPGVRMRPTVGLMVHLERAAAEQRGRRGIVTVREILPLADGRAESAMESEARLVMIDHGLPLPELQYPIRGRDGELWRVDFAWPEVRLAAEYESIDWHAGRNEMLRDKTRWGKIQELGWTIIPIVVVM